MSRDDDRFPKTRGRHLNHVAWLYDPLIERCSFGRERKFRELSLSFLAPAPGEKILDVGCGTGSLTLLVARALGGDGRVIGIDAAPRMIAIARRKAMQAGSAAVFAVGIAEALDCADASFDAVVSSMFFHHIDCGLKMRAFAEMRRVLVPGGRMLTADIDRPTTFLSFCAGWLGRWLLLQPELEDNLRGRLPEQIAAAGFVDTRRLATVHGMVSFFVSRKAP